MNEDRINVLRGKMTEAVQKYLAEKEIKSERVSAGEDKTLIKVDFGFFGQTKTRHFMEILLLDDSLLYLRMKNLINLGPAGALSHRVRAMVDWFEDKEDKGMQDVFMLQLVAGQYLESYPTANDLLWLAVESTNGYPLSQVRRDVDGEVTVTTYIGMDGGNIPAGLDEALTRLIVHTSAVVRICGLVDRYLLPESRGAASADALLNERWGDEDDEEDKDRPANEQEDEQEDMVL